MKGKVQLIPESGNKISMCFSCMTVTSHQSRNETTTVVVHRTISFGFLFQILSCRQISEWKARIQSTMSIDLLLFLFRDVV